MIPGAFILAVTNRGHSLLPSFPPVLWKAGHVSAAFAKLAARRAQAAFSWSEFKYTAMTVAD